MRNKILITGGKSRFANELIKTLNHKNVIYTNKKELNILNLNSIENSLKKFKPKYLIHLASLSRPMNIHEKNISKSIDLNIIGTANIVKKCEEHKIKLIYFSTNYVYPGNRGNYKEIDNLNPVNNYAWSKLGGEASVMLYKNSLILRLAMTEFPFLHNQAFTDARNNFIYNYKVAKILPLLLNEKGIINIGSGKTESIYDFAKRSNSEVKKVSINKIKNFPRDSSVNILKLKKILKNKIKI